MCQHPLGVPDVDSNEDTLGATNAFSTEEIVIFVKKVRSLFILLINPAGFIAMNAGGVTIGIRLHMVEILILQGRFLNSLPNYNTRYPEWHC